MLATALAVVLGLVVTPALFIAVYFDASRIDVSKPLLWGAVAAVPFALGIGLYLFVDAAPMTGVIMTANTGIVLYAFEREVTRGDDEPAEPGELLE
ncbi:hypothetical protein [Natronorubrum tibetense]|uniref:Uncharacterized protein n=1 Tax=Natronorubrum tibetense GA33 TaxID=1114856 RepID=L9VSV5_9EURY|nr:hypothetical protein [Natronorubrum tibetense]ELY40037.1 hypothetical protein C496_12819 [Natronorubrum tibetense GA33]